MGSKLYADSQIDIVVGEKRREADDVVRVQRCCKLVREVARLAAEAPQRLSPQLRRSRRSRLEPIYGPSCESPVAIVTTSPIPVSVRGRSNQDIPYGKKAKRLAVFAALPEAQR